MFKIICEYKSIDHFTYVFSLSALYCQCIVLPLKTTWQSIIGSSGLFSFISLCFYFQLVIGCLLINWLINVDEQQAKLKVLVPIHSLIPQIFSHMWRFCTRSWVLFRRLCVWSFMCKLSVVWEKSVKNSLGN